MHRLDVHHNNTTHLPGTAWDDDKRSPWTIERPIGPNKLLSPVVADGPGQMVARVFYTVLVCALGSNNGTGRRVMTSYRRSNLAGFVASLDDFQPGTLGHWDGMLMWTIQALIVPL